MRKTAGVVLILLVGLALAACGYHSAGHAAKLPPDLKTIAIPAFVNHTHTYRVEQVLNAAVVREFLSRTNYRIANQASDSADAHSHQPFSCAGSWRSATSTWSCPAAETLLGASSPSTRLTIPPCRLRASSSAGMLLCASM